jgi:hypothetical protein
MRSASYILAACSVAALSAASSCTSPVDFPWCSAEATDEPDPITRQVTWHADIQPILEARCERCHRPDDIGPFPLTTYEETFAVRESVREAVVSGSMPPWMPADCCNQFHDDFSLSSEQIQLVDEWVEQGAPEGDPANAAESLDPVGGLSRVDVFVEMDEAYTPEPKEGFVDDYRCFVMDWPIDGETYVTGMNPVPGAREIVHHLIVATVSGRDAAKAQEAARNADDGKPGFPCPGGLGEIRTDTILGGGMLGSTYPRGMGRQVPADSKIVIQVHYSVASSPPVPDKTGIEFQLADDADTFEQFAVANPAWLVGDAMRIEAGDPDAVYSYQFRPGLYTRNKPVLLQSATPHMHELGSQFVMGIARKDGSTECLLEIPRWDFGWEQPYWFAEPIRLEPGDEVFIECHFDNSLENQPLKEAPNVERGLDITLASSVGYHQFNFGRVPTHAPFVDVPLMFGFNLPGGHQFVLSARIRDEVMMGPDVSPVNILYGGGTIGFHGVVSEDAAFQPELSVLYSPVSFNGLVRDPERTGLTMVQFGIGGAFDW